MTLPASNLFDLSKAMTSTFNKSFYRLNSEYLTAIQQLEQWSESEHERILQQYQEKEKALQLSFEVMTKDYADQFQKQIKACEKPPAKKSKDGAVVTYLTAKFTSISADLQNKVIQIFQNQAKQIIKNGGKASQDKSLSPVTANAPLKSEAQSMKPDTTVKSQTTQIKPAVKQTETKTAPPKSGVQSITKANTTAKSESVQIKPAITKTGKENAPSKNEVQPVKHDTAVKSQITPKKPTAQKTGTENAPSKGEIQSVKSNPTVKSETAPMKPVDEKTQTNVAPAKVEAQPSIKPDTTVKPQTPQIKPTAQTTGKESVPLKNDLQITKAETTVKSQPVQIKPVVKKAETANAVAPNAPSTSVATTNPDVSAVVSGLSSISAEPPKVITPPPKSSAVVNAVRTPLPEHDYISIAHIGCEELAILYKAGDNNSTCMIQTIGEDLSLSSGKAKQTKISIPNVQGFCWLASSRRYVFMSPDALYLYDQKKSAEIHRESILVGTGQAVACDQSFIVCKTQMSLLFYEIELKKIYNTWNSPSMELERFHSVDILKSIVGLCSPTMCRFYRIIHGDQCKPILLIDIPRGGYSLSLYSVSQDLFMVRFLLIDNTKSILEMYENEKCCQAVNVINPLTSCTSRKSRQNTGPAFVLGNKPHRIEKMQMKIPF